MNFGKAFTYIFDDPDWFNKVLIPILVGLIPIVGQLVLAGWMLDLTKNVSNRVDRPLPELDFGRHLGRGFRWWLVAFVYTFPMFLLYLLIFVPLITTSNSNGPSFFAVILMVLGGILMFLFGLVLLVIMPAAQATFAIKDTFASAFDFQAIFALIKNNLKAWILVIGGTIVAGIIAPIGSIVFVIGALVTAFYSLAITAHLTGQAYAMSQTKDGAGISSF